MAVLPSRYTRPEIDNLIAGAEVVFHLSAIRWQP